MRWLALSALLAGCGGGDSDPGELEFRTGECAAAERVGQFRIDLAESFTAVQGRVLDGVPPIEIPDEVAADGDCRMRASPVLFCDPACSVDQTCSAAGTCVAQPQARSVGTVVIEGMVVPVEIEPSASNLYGNTGSLPHPGFEPGAAIRLEAAGGDYQRFALGGTGVSPIAAPGDAIPVEAGAAAEISWTASSGEAPISLLLDINPHGTTSSWIECEVADTGSAAIPAPLVDQLFDGGVSGFPRLVMARRTATSTDIEPGCVELQVTSEMEIPVSVPGLTSCTEDGECPEGQECLGDLTCG